jgi:hypothetical protein
VQRSQIEPDNLLAYYRQATAETGEPAAVLPGSR